MLIKNGNVITENGICENTDVLIEGNIIKSVGISGEDTEVFDAEGLYVCPGFIDIHTHGGHGGDFMDADDDSFNKALEFYSESGVTSLLPSTVAAPVERVIDMLNMVRKYIDIQNPKSRILGAHVEGPFLSFKNRGAHPEECLKVPSVDSYDFLIENSDVIKTVTISPELDGAAKMTKDLVSAGIVVSAGHDDGEKEKILPAIEAGLSHCTHLWCAMSTAVVRENIRRPGLLETGLSDDRLTVEIIADNHHMAPEMAKIVYKCKGADKMCIVSDSLRAGGMPPDGRLYSLGAKFEKSSNQFIVSDGVATLPDKSRLAGSIQPLSQMIKNLVNDAGIPLCDAVKMASLTPAKVIKADDKIGSIKEGKYADFCILDKKLDVVMTITNGKVVYKKENVK